MYMYIYDLRWSVNINWLMKNRHRSDKLYVNEPSQTRHAPDADLSTFCQIHQPNTV